MDKNKKKKLEARGWKVGDAADFLGLTPEEAQYIELKVALSASLKAERLKQEMTQVELAETLGTSQSRLAKMEAGDPTVSVDLLLKALVELGLSNKDLSRIIAKSGR